MPYPLLVAYLANIDNLRAEEGLFLLQIANDPKPTYQIDPDKSGDALEETRNRLLTVINAEKPYWEEEKLDRAALHRLKAEMEANRRTNA
jgi:hypothetical protein